jgi:hypothetical protein
MKYLALILAASLLTACGEEENFNLTIMQAHAQYAKAVTLGHAGNRSSYLPHVGETKADDYKNCVTQGFNKSVWDKVPEAREYPDMTAHDFCAWHAEIGKWQY